MRAYHLLIEAPVASVGEAGTFDGIFVTGLLAVFSRVCNDPKGPPPPNENAFQTTVQICAGFLPNPGRWDDRRIPECPVEHLLSEHLSSQR